MEGGGAAHAQGGAVHAAGTYFFTGGEILRGMADVPFDHDWSFDWSEVVYFWLFFVVANAAWFIVSLALLWQSACACTRTATLAAPPPSVPSAPSAHHSAAKRK